LSETERLILVKPYSLRPLSLLAGWKIRIRHALPLVALLCFVGGCEKKASAPDEKALFQAIQENADALNKKDLDGVMATIHPKAPSFASTRDIVSQTFSQVTLKFTVSDLKVKDASPEEAHVSFVQKTEKVDGGKTIPLNTVEGVDTLRPDNGKWKIFDTTTTKVTRLEGGQPSAAGSPAPAPGPSATPGPAATPAPASTPAATESKPDQKPPASTEKPPQ
jgi:uncharacterized protein YchJ